MPEWPPKNDQEYQGFHVREPRGIVAESIVHHQKTIIEDRRSVASPRKDIHLPYCHICYRICRIRSQLFAGSECLRSSNGARASGAVDPVEPSGYRRDSPELCMLKMLSL